MPKNNTSQPTFLVDENLWSEEITLPRNAFIIQKGETEQHLYLITQGAVRVFYETENQEHCIRLGYKNNLINSLPSFLSGKPSTLNIQTLKKTVYKKAPKSLDFDAQI